MAGVWLALTGGAVLAAGALDQPVGAGERDAAQPALPDPLAEAPAQPDEGAGAGGGDPSDGGAASPGAIQLPPFAMVLDHQLPSVVAGLEPAAQAEELRQRAMATNDPVTLVELGSVLQVLGDVQSAEFSYRSALDADPGNLAARVGLALVPATASPGGLDDAAAALDALAADEPGSQLVHFNRAWVALYAGDEAEARAALRRTRDLGAGTRLGRTAQTLLVAMRSVTFEAGP